MSHAKAGLERFRAAVSRLGAAMTRLQRAVDASPREPAGVEAPRMGRLQSLRRRILLGRSRNDRSQSRPASATPLLAIARFPDEAEGIAPV